MALQTSENAQTDTGSPLTNAYKMKKRKSSIVVVLWFNILIVPVSNSNPVEAKGLFSILIIAHLCVRLPLFFLQSEQNVKYSSG